MRRHYTVLGVVLLVLLAGCSGVPFAGDDTDGEIANGAENGFEDENGGDDLVYPSGYEESGVTDVDAALSVHESAVAERSELHLESSIQLTIPDENGEEAVQELTLETSVDESGAERSRIELTDTTAETYRSADGSVYTRIDDGENVQYDEEVTEPDVVSIEAFEEALTATDLTLEDVSDGDPVLLTYTGSGTLDGDTEFGDVEDVETEIVVDADGAIHSYHVSYTVPDGADVEATFEFEYEDVTVDEPDWLDEARG